MHPLVAVSCGQFGRRLPAASKRKATGTLLFLRVRAARSPILPSLNFPAARDRTSRMDDSESLPSTTGQPAFFVPSQFDTEMVSLLLPTATAARPSPSRSTTTGGPKIRPCEIGGEAFQKRVPSRSEER